MEMNEYIEQVKVEYPNGYSDYIKANPSDGVEMWKNIYRSMNVSRQVGEYLFDYNSISDMENWESEKFWTFIGEIRHSAKK